MKNIDYYILLYLRWDALPYCNITHNVTYLMYIDRMLHRAYIYICILYNECILFYVVDYLIHRQLYIKTDCFENLTFTPSKYTRIEYPRWVRFFLLSLFFPTSVENCQSLPAILPFSFPMQESGTVAIFLKNKRKEIKRKDKCVCVCVCVYDKRSSKQSRHMYIRVYIFDTQSCI